MSGDRLERYSLLGIAIALTAAAYWSIIRNYFFLDDFFYLYLIRTESLASFLFKPWFGHLFAFRNAFFILFFKAFGTDPKGYFCVILLTHLLNVALLFRLIRLQTDSNGLAYFGSTLWGICTLHAEALGWLSVYGHCLVATLLLAILSQVARIAATPSEIPRAAPVLWGAALVCAATSYGVGIGVAMVFPAALFLMIPAGRIRRKHAWFFAGLALFTPGMWWLANTLWAEPDPAILSSWSAPEGLGKLILPMLRMTFYLFATGLRGLTTGIVTTGIVSSQVTLSLTPILLTSGAGLVFLAVLLRARTATKRWVLAWVLIALACYGIVAVGRAPRFMLLSEQDVAVFPRYQYVATIGLSVIACLAIDEVNRRLRIRWYQKQILLIAWLVIGAAWLWYSPRPIDHHSDERENIIRSVELMQSLIAQARPGEDVYIQNLRVRDGWAPTAWYAGIFIVFFDGDVVDGKRIHFVATPQMVREAREHPDSRLSSLLVTAEEALNAGWHPPGP